LISFEVKDEWQILMLRETKNGTFYKKPYLKYMYSRNCTSKTVKLPNSWADARMAPYFGPASAESGRHRSSVFRPKKQREIGYLPLPQAGWHHCG
jgi:hypothetical protein